MVATILVDELDKEAFKLVEALKHDDFIFTAAALMRYEDQEDWYLILGIPDLAASGSRDYYVKIYQTIKVNHLNLSLSDVKLIDHRDLMLEMLRKLSAPTNNVERLFFRGSYVGGSRFPDSIVYYVK